MLVGLEGKNRDNVIVGHIANIKDTLGVQKIYFVHISRDLKVIDNFYAKRLVINCENKRKQMILEMEQSLLKLGDQDYEILVKDGNPELEIPRIVSEKGIDLLVLGRRPRPGMTHLLRQLTDTAKCSVLIVPKMLGMKSGNLAPIDFSCSSKQAINMAYYFKRLGIKKKGTYSYSKRLSFHSRSNRSVAGHSEVKGQNITDYSKKIVPEHLIASCAIILEKRENLARKIINYSLSKGANIIMIGCRGTNQLASFLSGSIAIKLAEISYRLPVLIDKKRRLNTDTLEAFISL